MPKWTTEMDDMFKEKVVAGNTASAMADVLRKAFSDVFSRNSVIGRMHRLGLCSERKVSQNTIPREPRPKRLTGGRVDHTFRAKAKVIPFIPPVEPAPEPVIIDDSEPRTDLVTLFDLGLTSCHWPYGNGTPDDPFLFCGRTACEHGTNSSYCRFHAERAFVKPMPRTGARPFRRAA